jgi:predicted RNA-binding protein with PIN domain
MRYLIDGYNLMYAGGLLGRKLGPHGFHKVRTRFLNDLAYCLGPVDAHQTTVVFDASDTKDDRPRAVTHKGLSIVFAVGDESADERIEQLLAQHPIPKSLTVISSDRRLVQAATRRRARAVSSEDFWVELDRRKSGNAGTRIPPEREKPPRGRDPGLNEAEHWQNEFRGLDEEPETREALGGGSTMLTDQEIAEIEREIERESG